MKMIIKGLRAATDIMLCRRCIVCGKSLLLEEKHLCIECMLDMPQTYFWTISHNPMADRFNEIIQNQDGAENERYVYAAALFFYHSEAGYRHIPQQLKYQGNLKAGRYFGRMLGIRLASSCLFSDADMVIPVPLHWIRKWKRGYNQAEIIAAEVADVTGVPIVNHLLKRCRRTKTQTKMNIEEKAANVSGAFSVNKKELSSVTCKGISLRHLILVDDVFTTGNTLSACYKALREVFPPSVRISVVTLGFVGEL